MIKNPVVSAIIPTYNRERSVLQALHSIEAQSFQDIEIIIIDDGSTDRTKEMILASGNPKIKYFHQENQGLPSAWNVGIEKSQGKYLAFLDSDDYWLANKLEKQVSFLSGTNQRFMGCVTGYFLHTLNNNTHSIIPTETQTSLREIIRRNILHLGTTFMCERLVFNEIGDFDKNLWRGQDSDWLIRYRKKFELGVVPEVLAGFNQHLARSGEIMERSSLYFLKKHKATIQEQGSFFYRKKTASIYRDLAYQFSRENNKLKAAQYSKKSILTYPMASPGLWLILMDYHLGTQLKRRVDSLKYPGAFK